MRHLIASVPVLFATIACAPVPWTTYGSTIFPRPVDPQCVDSVLRTLPEIDSSGIAAQSPPGFGTVRGTVEYGTGPSPHFAEVKFGAVNGTGTIHEFEAGPQIRVTASWTWPTQGIPYDTIGTVEARLQQYVVTIWAVCDGGLPVDKLDFRHSWEIANAR